MGRKYRLDGGDCVPAEEGKSSRPRAVPGGKRGGGGVGLALALTGKPRTRHALLCSLLSLLTTSSQYLMSRTAACASNELPCVLFKATELHRLTQISLSSNRSLGH